MRVLDLGLTLSLDASFIHHTENRDEHVNYLNQC